MGFFPSFDIGYGQQVIRIGGGLLRDVDYDRRRQEIGGGDRIGRIVRKYV